MIIPELAFESEWILKAITNEIRRKILYLIEDYFFLTYSDLLRELKLSTGKLNFHLRQLTGLIDSLMNCLLPQFLQPFVEQSEQIKIPHFEHF